MERSEIRVSIAGVAPHCAALHPGYGIESLTPSLRAPRSNPETQESLDCFVASAPRNDDQRFSRLASNAAAPKSNTTRDYFTIGN
jgi:hypothetical protein